MKKLLPFIIVLAVLGCKKNEDVISPAGVYQIFTEVTFTQNGRVSNQAGAGTLTISRINGDLYELNEDYLGYYRKFQARLSGRTFTVTAGNAESIRVNNNDYQGVLDGSGDISADGNNITLSIVTNLGVPGIVFKKQSFIKAKR